MVITLCSNVLDATFYNYSAPPLKKKPSLPKKLTGKQLWRRYTRIRKTINNAITPVWRENLRFDTFPSGTQLKDFLKLVMRLYDPLDTDQMDLSYTLSAAAWLAASCARTSASSASRAASRAAASLPSRASCALASPSSAATSAPSTAATGPSAATAVPARSSPARVAAAASASAACALSAAAASALACSAPALASATSALSAVMRLSVPGEGEG